MKYKYILFDLDGTVIESAYGIRSSLEYAINSLGKPLPDLSDYTIYIGPPLIDTFKNYCGFDDDTAEHGARLYRDYYNEKGKFLNRTYAGIPQLLERLRAEGSKLAICTSKYEKFAEEISEILGITEYFDAVCGSNLDGSRKDKKDLIPYAIEKLGGNLEADREKTVMIGDTWFDAKGARLSGIDFIGVEYGYGSLEAMREQGTKAFAKKPMEIFDLIN